MKKWLLRIVYAALVLTPVAAIADYTATQGAGSTVFAFVCSTTKICPAMVLIDSTNVEKATASNPLRTDPTGTTTQPVSAASLPLPTGAATAALQTTINTTLGSPMQQTGGSVAPSTLAAWGLTASTQNGATPTNSQLVMGQFNTTPTTITSGNVSPLQMDANGNLLVNIKAGAGSGGTALADASAFTQGTTSITPIGCLFINSYTALTTGHAGVLSCTSAGSLHTTVDNSNPNGLAAMASSSPVVVASDQKVSTQNASVAINISTATTTQLVAISGSTKIYVTAWDVIAGGTGNITLEYGTGTNCGTGTTALTGAYPLTAQAGISKGDGSAPVLIVPSGNALCALTSAAVQMSGSLTFQQF